MLYPSQGKRNGTLTVSQSDDQQLMHKPNFGAIYYQPYLLKMTGLTDQSAPGYGFIPIMYINRWISQKPAQALEKTQQPQFSRHLPNDSAKINQPALMDFNYQPSKISDTSYSSNRLQLSHFHKPSMIGFVDRHRNLLFFGQDKEYIYRADQSYYIYSVWSLVLIIKVGLRFSQNLNP